MLDTHLRPLKDSLFDSITSIVPSTVTPLHITILAFVGGIQACVFASFKNTSLSLFFWALNRALDCLDGAVARQRHQSSDLGGFLDLLGDFIVYSAIPISCALSFEQPDMTLWLSVAVLESSFHVNNFVLFYVAAILEKGKAAGNDKQIKRLTSLSMKPALIEGTESAVFFTAMLAYPQYLTELSWCMAFLVSVGIFQRTTWLIGVL